MSSRVVLALACAGSLSACGGGEPIEIPFAARAGSAPLACGTDVTGLGTTGTTFSLADFRLYVHDVRVTDSQGEEHGVELEDDGTWQTGEVALLDFEDATGACINGTPETRTHITGTTTARDVARLRFRVGVPESLNHQDVSTASSPLNLSSLFWSWKAGYKFIRLDAKTTGMPNGFNLHLGSNGCSGDPVACSEPGRFDVTLPFVDPGTQQVVADVAAVLAGSDLDSNAEATPPGCQGSPATDPDCVPIFERLGLEGGGQVMFHAAAR